VFRLGTREGARPRGPRHRGRPEALGRERQAGGPGLMDAERARRFPFAARPGSTPLRIARAEGAWLHTEDGRAILDAAGGAIVATVGQGRGEGAGASARELEGVAYVVPPFATESRVRLVERLVSRWLPAGLTRVAFASGGSEAVDTALRIARLHHLCA